MLPERGDDGDGVIEFPLCDFTCEIIEEITEDNGLEDQRLLRIKGVRQDGLLLPVADVSASKFYGGQGNWANEAWGTKAFIYPGSQKKDNLRSCIHKYSQLQGDISIRTVYKYAGWEKIADKWVYLSGSGAITSAGLDEAVHVDLGLGHMAKYSLPKPPDKEQLKPLANLILDLLKICPNKPCIGTVLLSTVVGSEALSSHELGEAKVSLSY